MRPTLTMHAPPTLQSSTLTRARWHFGALIEVIEALRRRLREVGERMTLLQGQYRAVIGRCRMLLYVRNDPAGFPRGLYWGGLKRFERNGVVRKLITHLPGRLTGRSVFRVALRWQDRALFFDFDRRRLALNAERSRTARGLARASRSVSSIQIPPNRLPPLPPPIPPDPLIERAWRLAWACASTETDMATLVLGGRTRAQPFLLFPYVTCGRHGYLSAGWATPEIVRRSYLLRRGRRHVAARLSGQILRSFRVPRADWPALRAIDWRMRALRREHHRYAAAIGRIRRLGHVRHSLTPAPGRLGGM